MLTLITSNSLDALADALAARQTASGLHPLQSTTLIVPSLAHSRWVRLALAERLGAAASFTAQFPAQFIWQLTTQMLAHVPGVERAAPVPGEQLRWWVFDWLTQGVHSQANISNDAQRMLRALAQHETERFKLAEKLARLLGNYWVHRPEWLLAWQEGKVARDEPTHIHTPWQRELWRYVAEQTGLTGKRHPFELLAQQLKRDAGAVPPRVVMLGVHSLAPLYLQVLAEVAEHSAFELYAVSPSEQYWGDVQDARALMRYAKLTGLDEVAEQEEEEPSTDHPSLLAAWGKHARDFHACLTGLNDTHETHEDSCFVAPHEDTALGCLKHEWLALEEQAQWPVSSHDQSLHLHGCTTLQRQVEVLYEALAHAFASDSSLKPSDIAVLACDMELAAPHVHAVFGAHTDRPMPYTVTGMPDHSTHAHTQALQSLLLMGQGRDASALHRFEADALLRLIAEPLVAARYALGTSDIALITQWVRQLNIRNGYGDEPASLALSPAHSWQHGLARLMQAPAACMPSWMSPSQMQSLVQQLQALLTCLAACRDGLHAPRPLAQWQQSLHQLLADFFVATDEAATRWLLDTREAINALAQYQPPALRTQALSAQTAQRLLSLALATQAPGAVPSGSITFAQLGELRGLPYRHIVVLGIDQHSFTPNEPKLEFDLMLVSPRKGDRASRADEVGALLDAVLAASDSVQLYAQTQDAQTGEALPLPAAVQALLTQLQQRTRHVVPAIAWTTTYAKQRFLAPSEYAAKPIYSNEYTINYQYNIWDNNSKQVAVYENMSTEPASLEDYAHYLAAPAATQLKARYGVSLRETEDEVQPVEPAQLKGLEAWLLNQALVKRDLQDGALPALLPPGVAGHMALQAAQEKVAPFIEAVQRKPSPVTRSEYRSLKLHDLAWLGLQQAQRALAHEAGQAVCIGSEQVLVMQDLPTALAAQLTQQWRHAWQRDALRPPWLPTDSTWAWLTEQCSDKKPKKGMTLQDSALAAAQDVWEQEREQPLWQCLHKGASDVELSALAGWHVHAQACFGDLLPYVKLIKLAKWIERSDE
jgi:exodeoxyribonuclease V gamma subunit